MHSPFTADSCNGSVDISFVFKATSIETAATGNITWLAVSEYGDLS